MIKLWMVCYDCDVGVAVNENGGTRVAMVFQSLHFSRKAAVKFIESLWTPADYYLVPLVLEDDDSMFIPQKVEVP